MDQFYGTWLRIKTGHDYGEPEFIEFHNDEILHFGICTSNENGSLVIKPKRKERFSDIKLEFLDEKRIRFYIPGKIRTQINKTETVTVEREFATDYVKLEPTKTKLTENEIQELEFKAEWKGEKLTVIFNKDLSSPAMVQINKKLNKEGKKIILENLRGTFFVSIFRDSIRSILLGIKEIDREKAVLFGFPEEPYEIVAPSSGKVK